jgi:hypothetical protein
MPLASVATEHWGWREWGWGEWGRGEWERHLELFDLGSEGVDLLGLCGFVGSERVDVARECRLLLRCLRALHLQRLELLLE